MPPRRMPLWALAWLVALLAVIAVFLANKDAVDRLFDAVGLTPVLYPSKTNALVLRSPAPASPDDRVDPLPGSTPSPTLFAEPTPPADPPASTSPTPTPTSTTLPVIEKTQGYLLYFLKLGPDGRAEPTPFSRDLPVGNTPLGATLRALLQGPSLQDQEAGAISLIPQGTKLLTLRVKDQTAYLSFSPEFERNTLGVEGLLGQLREVVWTATQFPSVDRVQILIQGQYRETLGEEAVPIGQPITRGSF